MKGQTAVIDALNQALANELTAINQYYLHSKMVKVWGINRLAKFIYDESIEEMWHADWLIERILFLEGTPSFEYMESPIIANDVKGIIEADFAQEEKAIPVLREAVNISEKEGDYVSRELFQKILAAEENHMDELEVHLRQMETMGMENYLLSQSGLIDKA